MTGATGDPHLDGAQCHRTRAGRMGIENPSCSTANRFSNDHDIVMFLCKLSSTTNYDDFMMIF
jgi:hypothetical protein